MSGEVPSAASRCGEEPAQEQSEPRELRQLVPEQEPQLARPLALSLPEPQQEPTP